MRNLLETLKLFDHGQLLKLFSGLISKVVLFSLYLILSFQQKCFGPTQLKIPLKM